MGVLQPGVHKVVVADVRFKHGNDGYEPQLSIYFRDEAGDGIAWYLKLGQTKEGFSKKNLDYELDNLDRLGWKAEENGYRFEELQDPLTCPFANAETTIRVDAYNGKPQFKWIEGGSSFGSGERMEPAAATSYMDTLRARLAANGVNIPAARRPAPKPAPAPAPAATKPPINEPWGDGSEPPF